MLSPNIRSLDAKETRSSLPALSELLTDAVRNGASVGYILPFTTEDARPYWQGVAAALYTPFRILLVAEINRQIVGTVQLDLADRPNGSHRAEVAKLIVHTDFRRRGIGRALMAELETIARARGRTVLVLDTSQGDVAEGLYMRIGYQRAGAIPQYAQSIHGVPHATVFMYKLLDG